MTAKRCEEMTANGATPRVKIVEGRKYSGSRRVSTWSYGTLVGIRWETHGRTKSADAIIMCDGRSEPYHIHPSLVQPA
jgi:hypothetical protein